MSEGERIDGMGLKGSKFMWTRKKAKYIKDIILKYFRRYPGIKIILTVEDGVVKVWAIVRGVRNCICKVRVLKLKGFYKGDIDLRVENLINTRGNLLGGELEDVIYYRVKGLIKEYEEEKSRKMREEQERERRRIRESYENTVGVDVRGLFKEQVKKDNQSIKNSGNKSKQEDKDLDLDL